VTSRAAKTNVDDERARLERMAAAGSPHAKSLLAALNAPPLAAGDVEEAKAVEPRRVDPSGEGPWVSGAEVTDLIARWHREAEHG
jgi:hypothetical protein